MSQSNQPIPHGETRRRPDRDMMSAAQSLHPEQYAGIYEIGRTMRAVYQDALVAEQTPASVRVAAPIIAETVAPVVSLSEAPSYRAPELATTPRIEAPVAEAPLANPETGLDEEAIRQYINSISLEAEAERPEVLDEAA